VGEGELVLVVGRRVVAGVEQGASAMQEVAQDGRDVVGARGGSRLEASLAMAVGAKGAVERQQMEVEMGPEIGGEALQDEDGAALGVGEATRRQASA
jgi:hypothetical protein